MKRLLYMDLSPSPGGSIISLYQLTSHLDRSRFQPLVILSSAHDYDRFQTAGIPVRRVTTRQWQLPGTGARDRKRFTETIASAGLRGTRLWRALADGRRLYRHTLAVVPPMMRVIRDFRPHLIHLNVGLPLIRSGAIAGRLARVPVISHCRSFLTPTAGDNRFLVPALQGMLFISQAVADAQLAAMPRPPRHQVVPNAVDVAEYQIPVNGPAMRRQLGVPLSVPLVGMVGRISPWKGQHVFVEALAQVSQHLPGVHGVIVGLTEEADGPGYEAQVRRLATELGVSDRLHLVGFRDDVPQVIGALDVIAHCSVKPEPFGRVIIEGMAAGRPVIGTAAGGVPEIITHGVDGLLVPPGDPSALAQALAELLADAGLRQRLGSAGRQTVHRRYRVEQHVATIQTFYEEILSDQ